MRRLVCLVSEYKHLKFSCRNEKLLEIKKLFFCKSKT